MTTKLTPAQARAICEAKNIFDSLEDEHEIELLQHHDPGLLDAYYTLHRIAVCAEEIGDSTPTEGEKGVMSAATVDWQPIETAPDSCRGERPKYVLFYNGHHVGVGCTYPPEYEEDDREYVDETGQFILPAPTLWAQLPEPPKGEAK